MGRSDEREVTAIRRIGGHANRIRHGGASISQLSRYGPALLSEVRALSRKSSGVGSGRFEIGELWTEKHQAEIGVIVAKIALHHVHLECTGGVDDDSPAGLQCDGGGVGLDRQPAAADGSRDTEPAFRRCELDAWLTLLPALVARYCTGDGDDQRHQWCGTQDDPTAGGRIVGPK